MLLRIATLLAVAAIFGVGTGTLVQAHLPIGHFVTRNFNCVSNNGSAFVCLAKDIQTFTTKNFVCVSQGIGKPFECAHK